jgi:hypothetical protein
MPVPTLPEHYRLEIINRINQAVNEIVTDVLSRSLAVDAPPATREEAVRVFFNAKCQLSLTEWVSSADLYNHFEAWCSENNYSNFNFTYSAFSQAFNRALQRGDIPRTIRHVRRAGKQAWLGFELI